MPFEETKVYYDGSHYVAIPHTERGSRKRKKLKEEPIVVENRTTTRKELFNDLYASSESKTKRSKKKEITDQMKDFFPNKKDADMFVEENFQRKRRNLICRRTRLFRKAAMQEFNYFCTFTYDPQKMDEDTFRTKLQYVFRHNSTRKGWKYIGVWERSPEKHRLHFHGIFYIPDGTMLGEFEEKSDYSIGDAKRRKTKQNTYFAERFGRNVFDRLEHTTDANRSLTYIIKYLEKTEERIVYSKGMKQYFISDVMEEDVACPCGIGDAKLLLFDDFICYDQGEIKGQVSPKVIAEMRKTDS